MEVFTALSETVETGTQRVSFDVISTLNSSLFKFHTLDLPRDQHCFFVHGDEAEVLPREADAAVLQGELDALGAVERETAVLLDQQLTAAREREPRQTVQPEGGDLQPLRRKIDHIGHSAHKNHLRIEHMSETEKIE